MENINIYTQNKDIELIKTYVNMLNYYRDCYYNDNKSIISDKEYDELFDKLKELENRTGFVLSNSPTQTVGYEVKSELQKVKHSHPMLSLDKTKDTKDIIKFSHGYDIIMSCKMDGLTILLSYDGGKLVQAETRGNGEEGEIVTHNAKVFSNIPLTIPYEGHVEIEGEAIITYRDFIKINSSLSDDNKYKNPRNLVSGSVRQLDSSIAKDRHIKFIAWKVPTFDGFYFSDSLEFARAMGFDVVPYKKIAYTDLKFVDEFVTGMQSEALVYSYPIDGLVVTYDNIEHGKSLGMTGHHPKHSLAYKFYDEEYKTVLKDIEWTMGKTGVLTPTAVFQPVEIDGTIVERASLHNLSVMYDLYPKGWHSGLTVTVYKANMIIPQISKVEHSINCCAKRLDYPTICPICSNPTDIKQENNSKVLVCTNPNCKGKLLGKLCHFVSKNAMNIDGLSEATLNYLIDEGVVSSFVDLYKLCDNTEFISKWKLTDGFGEKSVNKILDAIEKSKTTTLDKFINALSIPMVGRETAKLIAKDCDYNIGLFLQRLYNPCFILYQWDSIDGVGNVVSNCINEFAKTNYVLIKELSDNLNFETIIVNTNKRIVGKTFVITGSLDVFANRNEAKERIEQAGGKVAGSVSKRTDYLVNNDLKSRSNKNMKAKELGVKIITELELISLLEN